jgi:hypothetical protein
MIKIIQWLGKNKLIAVLLSIAVYFCIVTFHDEVTQLAIRMRNAIGRDRYNAYLAYGFLALLLPATSLLFYRSLRGGQRILKSALLIIVTAMMVVSFRLLMVYSIEAIHFIEYMIIAILLLPVIRSYGETVFWVTILGVLDELFQYFFLVPTFEYFDFNDNVLNLLGAGAGAIIVFIFDGDVIGIQRKKWHRSPAILVGTSLLILFFLLLLTGKITFNPAGIPGSENWFSLNRGTMPDGFWEEAYPGRRFHIMKPIEGISVIYLLFLAFFGLDYLHFK